MASVALATVAGLVPSGCRSGSGMRVVGPQISESCVTPIVGRSATETLKVAGGTVPYSLEWVEDGEVVSPSTLSVASMPLGSGTTEGAQLRFSVIPRSLNDEIVLNVDGGDSSFGGASTVALGDAGKCPIGKTSESTFTSGTTGVQCSRAVVGQPSTETVTVTGGTSPSSVQWVVDGRVVVPATLNVQSMPYTDSTGKGLQFKLTFVPLSVNELIVVNLNSPDPQPGGRAIAAVGNVVGACHISAAKS